MAHSSWWYPLPKISAVCLHFLSRVLPFPETFSVSTCATHGPAPLRSPLRRELEVPSGGHPFGNQPDPQIKVSLGCCLLMPGWNCPDLLCLAFQPAWDSLRAHCNFQLFLSAPWCTPSSSTGVVTESISRASLYLLLSPFPQSFTGTLPNKYPPPCNFLLMLLIRVTHNLN